MASGRLTTAHSPRKHFPWAKRPSPKKGADNLPSPNVDVAWVQGGHIVSGTQRIGRDVRAQGGEEKHERGEECTSAVVPLIDELERVPKNFAIKAHPCACHCDSDETGQSEPNGNYNQLCILTAKRPQRSSGNMWVFPTLFHSSRISGTFGVARA